MTKVQLNLDLDRVRQEAENYREDMTKFLRDLIKIGGESCEEGPKVERIKEEMIKLGYDKVEVDPLGNVMGWMGEGDVLIAYDSHIDTVGIGDISLWEFDPYDGMEDDEIIGGRGASDQLGGMVSSTYGAKIMKDLGLIPEVVQILVVGSVQ